MLAGWGEFIVALAVFFASHIIPTRPALRAALIRDLGARGYGAGYGLVSLVILVWVIIAAGRAPYIPLWDQAVWMRWAANLAMPVAIAFAVFALGAVNPFSFGGRDAPFDADHPGIAGVTRHPLLWALLIWAGAHLLVNGDLAHSVLFGLFAGFAAIGMRVIDARNRRKWGVAGFASRAAQTANMPFAALIVGRWRPIAAPSGWRALAAILVWAVLWHLHTPVIGLSPTP